MHPLLGRALRARDAEDFLADTVGREQLLRGLLQQLLADQDR